MGRHRTGSLAKPRDASYLRQPRSERSPGREQQRNRHAAGNPMIGLLLSLLLFQGTSSIEGTVVQASNQQAVAQTQIVAVPVNGKLKDSHIAVSDSSGKF